MDRREHLSGDSASFALPRGRLRGLREHPALSTLLILTGTLTVVAGLVGAVRRVAQFQQLDFRAVPSADGLLVLSVVPRSGAARAGLAWGDTIASVDGTRPQSVAELDRALFAHRVSVLDVERRGIHREVAYYPPAPQVDVHYLLVAFAVMFTLVVAGLVYLGYPTSHAGRFLALAQALFAAVVIPAPSPSFPGDQLLLLARDFGRLALPPLLVIFFATFPRVMLPRLARAAAFVPSAIIAAGRTALAVGFFPPVAGNVLLPEALDGATAILVVVGVAAAAALAIRSYLSSRGDPTRRRQVEWVALGAAAGFTPYLLLSLIPQLAGAELEVVSWIALLPLALVPLGVASSLIEFRLWDLEDIARHVMATVLAVMFGGVTFALLNYALTEVGFRLGNWRNLAAVAGGVVLAALTVPIRRFLLSVFERLQYRERLAARRALTTFAEEAVTHRDPEELLARLRQLLLEALGLDRVVTYLAEGERLFPAPPEPDLPVLHTSQIAGLFPAESERPLRAAKLWHRFPLARDGAIVGMLYCGRRRGELPLGHGERRLISALAAQAALALQNTLLLKSLRRQVEEHRFLEDYLERIFQSSAAALFICDARGRILRANRRAASLLGLDADELVGTALASVVELPVEWREVMPSDLAGVQVRFAASGVRRTGLLSTSALEVEPGTFDGRVVALDDISEQLVLEQRLAEQDRFAALGRLAAGLAHEVNTPVTGIASYAQLLHELTPKGDPRAPLVDKLEEQAFRVSRIVTNLLELARPAEAERQQIDLAAIAEQEVKQLHGEAGRLGVRLSCKVDGRATVSGNAVQLELVIHNLLRNALQATPPGGEVNVDVAADARHVQLAVTDTGRGVPAEMRESIFEPFVTTRQGRGGTGLGLAVTRDIVRAHGGEIAVESNVPTGTVVRVTIPATGRDDAHLDH